MTNNELRAILEARKAELQSQQEVLATAAERLKPQPIDPDALRILNEMGLTVPPVSLPDNPHVEQIEGVVTNCTEAVERIEKALGEIPADKEQAGFSVSQSMDWSINAVEAVVKYIVTR